MASRYVWYMAYQRPDQFVTLAGVPEPMRPDHNLYDPADKRARKEGRTAPCPVNEACFRIPNAPGDWTVEDCEPVERVVTSDVYRLLMKFIRGNREGLVTIRQFLDRTYGAPA